MKALRVDKKKLAVREIDRPEAGQEALVRVLLSGICNTDLEIARGYAGFKGTIGHEFVGDARRSFTAIPRVMEWPERPSILAIHRVRFSNSS